MILYMPISRTVLFLKEQQLDKLQKLADKTGAPVAELVRRAIDAYLLSRKKELK
jgi:predicted DNA-binding protein